ncbi:peptidoglycan recognition protein family protein [Streptomyces sp. NPDC054854]
MRARALASPGPSRRMLLAGALGLGAAAGWPASGRAHAAAAGGPSVFGCAAWGARPPSESVVILAAPPKQIVVHHTATRNVEDYSQQRAFALARAIQNYHMDIQGWIDTGQHFTISRGAFVTEGRHHSLAELDSGRRQVRSAHCVGRNDVSVGIENEGTYTSEEPPAQQFEALVALCTHICDRYGIAPTEIHGHRDFNDTACPGDRLYALLPRLRKDVAVRLGVRLGDPERPGFPDFPVYEDRDAWAGPAEYLPPGALDGELARWTGRGATGRGAGGAGRTPR